METAIVKKEALNKGHNIIVQHANSVVLKNQGDVDSANDILQKLNMAIKQLEAKRTKITKPINDGLRATNILFKEVSESLGSAYEILDTKVMDWRRDEKEKIGKENERLQLETEEKNRKTLAEQARRENIQKSHQERGHKTTELEEPVLETAPEVPALQFSDSTKIRLDWTWEVENLGSVPRKHLLVDNIGIGKLVRGGIRSIPGIRIFQKETRINERPF